MVALLVSAAAHLAFAGWVATRPPETTPPKIVSAEMIFTEFPTAPTVEEPPKAVEATPPPAKIAARPVVRAPPPVEPPPPRIAAIPVVRPPVKDSTPPPPPVEPPPAPRATDVPREVTPQDVPRALPADVPRLALIPSSTTVFMSVDAGVRREVEVINGGGLHGLEAPKDLVGVLTKETLGRGRVDRGLVHPYYSQLGKALLKNWDADRVAKDGLKGLAEQTSQNVKLYNEIWAERAQAYTRTGSPLGEQGPGNNRRAPVNDRAGGISGVDLEQRKELAKVMKEEFKSVRRAVIRVVQDTEGKLLKVELVQPSQDANVDKEALTDVKNAAEKLPPPPAEALDGKTTLSSLWTFELIVSISPPVPTFSFEFDEALGFIDARLPLDRRIYKKVRLYSVE